MSHNPEFAGQGLRARRWRFGNLLLETKAGGAGAAFLGHDGAEGVFVAFAAVGQLPGFDGAQGDGQAGGFAESALIVLIDAGVCQGLDEVGAVAGEVVAAVFHLGDGVGII